MKRISPLGIVFDHYATLLQGTGFLGAVGVLLLFLGVPILSSVVSVYFKFEFPTDQLSTLITVFSVFAALLFSAQISAFSISTLSPREQPDEILRTVSDKKRENLREFLSHLNSNISYLIFLSCTYLVLFLVLAVAKLDEVTQGAIVAGTVLHFVLNLMMVLKRAHVAFASAYNIKV